MHDRGRLARSQKPRHGRELLCEGVFRPLAHAVVIALLPLRVAPPVVVVAAAATGLAAALEIARGELIVAALLLQLKTVLDNADGQLARLSGRVTVFGRYLDAECDLLVDAAIFAALVPALGWWRALGGFLLLTFVLSVNFNVERLYRHVRGEIPGTTPNEVGATALLGRAYNLVYGPQDALAKRFTDWRIRRLGADAAVYHDAATVRIVANFGLSTQLAALGVCLALGRPDAYLWMLVGCVAMLVALALRRELLARRSVRLGTEASQLV